MKDPLFEISASELGRRLGLKSDGLDPVAELREIVSLFNAKRPSFVCEPGRGQDISAAVAAAVAVFNAVDNARLFDGLNKWLLLVPRAGSGGAGRCHELFVFSGNGFPLTLGSTDEVGEDVQKFFDILIQEQKLKIIMVF